MSKVQATFSIGTLCGSLFGALCAALGTSLLFNFCITALTVLVGFVFLGQHLLPDVNNNHEENLSTQQFKRRERIPLFIILSGLLALCAYCAEGSVAEWGGLLLIQEKGGSEAMAAMIYGLFSLLMTLARFAGDRLRLIIGDFTLLLAGALLSFVCELIAIYTDSALLCLTVFALMGLGLAPIMPVIMSRAGHYPGIRPALASTVISALAYSGILVIPPSLGYIAVHFGLERAYFLPLSCIGLIVLGAWAFRHPAPALTATAKE